MCVWGPWLGGGSAVTRLTDLSLGSLAGRLVRGVGPVHVRKVPISDRTHCVRPETWQAQWGRLEYGVGLRVFGTPRARKCVNKTPSPAWAQEMLIKIDFCFPGSGNCKI